MRRYATLEQINANRHIFGLRPGYKINPLGLYLCPVVHPHLSKDGKRWSSVVLKEKHEAHLAWSARYGKEP